MILKESIQRLMRKEHLTADMCEQALAAMLHPHVNSLQMSALLVLLHAKPETAEEISSFVNFMRAKMVSVITQVPVLDIVGTGGDGCHTVNISTGSALLAASCGVKIAKHGNRAVSSLAGSADVLEALGIKIDLTAEQVSRSIHEIGIGFCYAPHFHPLTQSLRVFRKQLNLPTTFNYLGPLLNPAHAAHLLMGVADPNLLAVMAEVLMQTGTKRSVVVHGQGLDEMNCLGPIKMIEINHQTKFEYDLDPLDYGFARVHLQDLQGKDAKTNARILMAAFQGKPGPIADTLILNAAVALYLYGQSTSIADAICIAKDHLYRGTVLALLKKWREYSYDQTTR